MSESAHSNNRNITLTLSQEEAVSCNDRYIAVIAGPGSGKTRVLTERVVRLIEEGHIIKLPFIPEIRYILSKKNCLIASNDMLKIGFSKSLLRMHMS